MKISPLIHREIDDIVEEWEGFARSAIPLAKNLNVEELQDHARVLLLAMASDVEKEQAGEVQHDKSRGGVPSNSPRLTETSHNHAEHRFAQGFTQDQMVSEYRALRASVFRRWMHAMGDDTINRASLEEAIRFGEAMDQGITESIAWYGSRVDKSRGLLLAVLGHDMRTPLGAARMSAQYLLQTNGLDSNQMKAVLRIVSSTGRMRAMVDDLLDFTQTALGMKLPLVRGAVNAGEVCGEVVAEVGALHPGSCIKLQRTGDLSGTWDGGRIAQLLTNLVTNSVQHGEANGRITVTVAGEPDAVSLRVHNWGKVVTTAARATLFDPLKQPAQPAVDRHAGSSGLGLGLYIAKEIAEAHGGSLEVHSSEEDGTTFLARLPRGNPASAEHSANAPDGS